MPFRAKQEAELLRAPPRFSTATCSFVMSCVRSIISTSHQPILRKKARPSSYSRVAVLVGAGALLLGRRYFSRISFLPRMQLGGRAV